MINLIRPIKRWLGVTNEQWRVWGFHFGGPLGWRHFHLGESTHN